MDQAAEQLRPYKLRGSWKILENHVQLAFCTKINIFSCKNL
jgi:hypothetical protein